MLIKQESFIDETLEDIARKMCVAATTAPKTRGKNQIETAVLKGETIKKLSQKMREIGFEKNISFFLRDAESILNAPVVVLIGTKLDSLGVPNCGFCGYRDCAEREKTSASCALAVNDLGIAVGSAVSIAMDFRVDNRIMFSAGKAALELNLFETGDIKIAFGIPLSATGKNPFFDRK